MATIRKRTWAAKGVAKTAWLVDYRDQAGKRRFKQFERKKEADTFLVRARGEVAAGTHTPDSAAVTLADAAALWLERSRAEGLEESTLRQYDQHARLHILPALGAVKLSRLTAPMVEEYRDRLVKRLSRPLAGKVLVSLRAILGEAQRRGLVAQNVAKGVRVRTPSRERKRPEIPCKAELRAMLAALQEPTFAHLRPLILTALFTGMRASELRGLSASAVDLDRAVVHVRQRADRYNRIGPPKSRAGTRDIPLAPIVVNALRDWLPRRPEGELDLVFPNRRGRVQTLANIINRGFGPLQAAGGLVDAEGRPKYGLHALRHAAASLFIEEGFGPKKLQAILGHATIAMTFDIYGHLFEDRDNDQQAMARVQARLVEPAKEPDATQMEQRANKSRKIKT